MTMFWVILALVVLVIALLSLRNIYEREGSLRDPEWKRMKMPVWVWILIVLCCSIPIINLIGLIILIKVLISDFVWDDDFQLRGPIGKFITWLTKEV